jgi:hypothetical protein
LTVGLTCSTVGRPRKSSYTFASCGSSAPSALAPRAATLPAAPRISAVNSRLRIGLLTPRPIRAAQYRIAADRLADAKADLQIAGAGQGLEDPVGVRCGGGGRIGRPSAYPSIAGILLHCREPAVRAGSGLMHRANHNPIRSPRRRVRAALPALRGAARLRRLDPSATSTACRTSAGRWHGFGGSLSYPGGEPLL